MSLELKTNGIYVQFGNRVWSQYKNCNDCKTSDCWYNLIKIINDEYAVVIGLSYYSTFFDKSYTKSDDVKKYLGITKIDLLEVIKELEKYDWNSLIDNENFMHGLYLCKLTKYKPIDNNYDENNMLALAKPYDNSTNEIQYIRRFDYSAVNDSFDAITLNNSDLTFFAWYSPCLEEYQHEQENTFPYKFVPFDLSLESNWREDYNQWKYNYERHIAKKIYDH